MSVRRAACLGVLVMLASACASSPPARPHPSSNVVTAEQLMDSGAQDVYGALQRISPVWLSSRGPRSLTDPTPSVADVYVNGVQVGDVTYLKSVNVQDVRELRFYSANEAGARFGMNHPGGVITVTTK